MSSSARTCAGSRPNRHHCRKHHGNPDRHQCTGGDRARFSRGARQPRLGEEEPALAAISASELLHGVHRATGALQRGRRETFVERVIAAIRVLPFDLGVARTHARLWADLRSRGDTVGAHDLLIAATALHHGLKLLTLNVREFRRVQDLEIVVWG